MQESNTLCFVDLFALMHTYVRIADTGSISKAAKQLRLSVAMTSRHLRSLEEHLGVALVRRTTRSLSLTEAGGEYLLRCRSILAEVNEAHAAVHAAKGPTGLLVVSLPVSFGLSQVGPLFPELLERYPGLKLDLRFEDRFVDLLTDGVDLAIRAGVAPPDSPFVLVRKLVTMERVLCATPAFLAQHGPINTVERLPQVPCMLQGSGTTQWSFDCDGVTKVVAVQGRLRTNNVFSLREAVLGGAGVGRLPWWIVEEDVRKKRLVRVLRSAKIPLIEVYGMYHQGSKGSATLRAVLDYLQTELPRRTKATASSSG